jgi:hypothetical protein
MNKVCSRCKIEKSLPEFNKDKNQKDGLESRCRDCQREKFRLWVEAGKRPRERRREWWKQHKEKALESQSRHRRRSRDVRNVQSKQYRENNPEKLSAQRATQAAAKRGGIPRVKTQTCINCQKQARHYHHWSYLPEHWLSVIPVCSECHALIHSGFLVLDNPGKLAIHVDN